MCPTLVPTFVQVGRNHTASAYAGGSTPAESAAGSTELAIYTWPDATLFELADLVRDKVEVARTKVMVDGQKQFPALGFSLVYPDRNGDFCVKTGGVAEANNPDERRTLQELGWEPGDCLDVAIFDTDKPKGGGGGGPRDRRREGGGAGGGGGGGRGGGRR